MKKLLALAAVLLFSGPLIATVHAGSIDPAPLKQDDGQVKYAAQTVKKRQLPHNDPGTSVDEKYKRRVAAKKRAYEMKKKLLNEGRSQTTE